MVLAASEQAGSFFITVAGDLQSELASDAAWQDGTLSPAEIEANNGAGLLSDEIRNVICSELGFEPDCDDVEITGINLSGGGRRRRLLVKVDSPAVETLTDSSLDLMSDPEGESFVRAIRQSLCGKIDCDDVTVTPA